MPMTRTWTEAELMALPDDGMRRELVGGEIVVMSPAGYEHGRVIMELAIRLGGHVAAHGLGRLCDSSTGVWMLGGNLRVPDVTFFSSERIASILDPQAFCRVPPDLAVEVLSPSDSRRDISQKVDEYLASDVRMIWVIDPRSRSATVHRPAMPVRTVDAGGELLGEDVVAGFRCTLREILD